MKVNVRGINVTLSTRTEEYAEKKLAKLERYLPNIAEASLELRNEKRNGKEHPVAQLTVRNIRGTVLRAEDKKQDDMFAAIDVVVDKIYKQIRSYKGKTKKRKGGSKWVEAELAWEGLEEVPLDETEIDDYDNQRDLQVLRRKVISLTPMSEQEAIDQMELLGHSFFVFYNGTEDTINVLYRREDGNYGILTPQID
jgi:putative sigma-54 modulation protein